MIKKFLFLVTFMALMVFRVEGAPLLHNTAKYSPRGVGGGGAMAGYSISPYTDLRFVGTDMGTLFRSSDRGQSWTPVNQTEAKYNSDLEKSADVGFSSDPKVVFFADAGREPKRSHDGGIHWSSVMIPLSEGERILYWTGDSSNSKIIYAGTTEGLYRSHTGGDSWVRVSHIQGHARGTVILRDEGKNKIFHANDSEIFISLNDGESFKSWHHQEGTKIRGFTGGIDAKGLTLAFIDTQGREACTWALHAKESTDEQKKVTIDECGFVWIHKGRVKNDDLVPHFIQNSKEAGRFIRMAENDSQTIYVTGGNWVRQYGSKIWVSRDAGVNFKLMFQVYDWDQHPYKPWPKSRLEYSAVGLDVGWDDNAPASFVVNRKHSSEAGGTGYYFLHTTDDYGEHWKAPFTKFADSGDRAKSKRWKSTGLEVTSILKIKFHPKDSKIGYASVADLGGYVTEDGGESFRISKVKYNTNYDYAFDPLKKERVFAASGNRHDFPLNFNEPIVSEGGIFISEDKGRSFKRLTPENKAFNRQFLSVAYDSIHHIIYGGTEGAGVVRSTDQGKHWEYINQGFHSGEVVIPQLETDPKNGDLYALVTGDAPDFLHADDTGIYKLIGSKFKLLRKTVQKPQGLDESSRLWLFPSAFAIDFSKADRKVMWLTDIENKNAWLATGAWKSTDGGDTWVRKIQSTHPTSIAIDPAHPDAIFVSGLYQLDGKWGQGGALYTTDGGTTWKKNETLPLSANLFSFTPDPNHSGQGFFNFFGGGMLYGPSY